MQGITASLAPVKRLLRSTVVKGTSARAMTNLSPRTLVIGHESTFGGPLIADAVAPKHARGGHADLSEGHRHGCQE